jgi:hypothetical protein
MIIAFAQPHPATAQEDKPTEEDYYRMVTIPLPQEAVLEVGGLEWLDDAQQRLLACTRRGELWVIDNAYADAPQAGLLRGETAPEGVKEEDVVRFQRMLFGLHEPLGMLRQVGTKYADGIYMAQRSELTRVNDTDGDDRIDLVSTVCNQWEISGSYHEYAFGPKLDGQGRMWITLNRPFGGEPEGKAAWRGWAVTVDDQGRMHPQCTGLRSPAGLGANAAGDMFYTDNQGDWVAVCKLSHLKPGSFHGNPLALASCDEPKSNIKHPGQPPSGLKLAEVAEKYPAFMQPTVWFPYPRMGKSSSDVLLDDTGGKFGPFAGQLFVGDQSTSIVSRVFLEKVDGEYQGVCFPFRERFQCGVMRMCWGHDGSMFAGQTNRGWGSAGGKPYGLQRLVWSGETPFEVHEMRAAPDGFDLTFTMPVDPATAGDVKSYGMQAWTYYYHSAYGCPPVDQHALEVTKAEVAPDGRNVHLMIDGLARGHVHALRLDGVRSKSGLPLLHGEAYYTLNRIPAARILPSPSRRLCRR